MVRAGLSKTVLLGSGHGVIRNGLIAEYRFNQTGQSLTDFSGKGNIGTLGSAAGADDNDPTWSTTGLAFTTNDYCRCGTSLMSTETSYTIQAVFYATDNNSTQGAIASKVSSTSSGAGRKGFVLAKGSGGTCYIYQFASDAGGTFNGTACGNYPATTWFHVAALCNGTNIWGYIGTTASAGAALAAATAPNPSETFTIGKLSYTGNWYLEGTLAYLIIYNRALSDSEVKKNYTFMKTYLKSRGITVA